MATKGGSVDNKNVTYGIVLGVLILAIIGWWWYQSSDSGEPERSEAPASVSQDAPPEQPRRADRPSADRPDMSEPTEDRPEVPQPTGQPGSTPRPRGGSSTPRAAEKENTSPPA